MRVNSSQLTNIVEDNENVEENDKVDRAEDKLISCFNILLIYIHVAEKLKACSVLVVWSPVTYRKLLL